MNQRSGSAITRQIATCSERKQAGACEIDVEADRFVDRHFERRCSRSAAERKHDGEAREAEQENERREHRRLALAAPASR